MGGVPGVSGRRAQARPLILGAVRPLISLENRAKIEKLAGKNLRAISGHHQNQISGADLRQISGQFWGFWNPAPVQKKTMIGLVSLPNQRRHEQGLMHSCSGPSLTKKSGETTWLQSGRRARSRRSWKRQSKNHWAVTRAPRVGETHLTKIEIAWGLHV